MLEKFSKATFQIISLDSGFEGYTSGVTWNGFACPYFERAEAERILTASAANGYHSRYDAAADAYIVRHRDDPPDFDPEVFRATTIEWEGRALTAYPIGAFHWAWEHRSSHILSHTSEQGAQA